MPDINTVVTYTGALVSVLGALTAIWIGVSQRRKNAGDAEQSEANAQKTLAEATTSLIEPLQRRIKEQGEELKLLRCQNNEQAQEIKTLQTQVVTMGRQYERELAELRAGINILTQQVISLGAEPYYPPKTHKKGD